LDSGGTVGVLVDGVTIALERLAQHGAEFILVFDEEERFHREALQV